MRVVGDLTPLILLQVEEVVIPGGAYLVAKVGGDRRVGENGDTRLRAAERVRTCTESCSTDMFWTTASSDNSPTITSRVYVPGAQPSFDAIATTARAKSRRREDADRGTALDRPDLLTAQSISILNILARRMVFVDAG